MNSSPRHSDLEKEDSIPTASDDSLDIAYDPQMDNDQIEDEYEEEYEEDVFRSKLYQPTPVSATEEVKKTNRPDLYNSLVYLQTTQNEMKQEQFTIKKEQMELNKGLLTLNSKMDDLMTILLGEKKSDLPSHLKKKEDVSALKMAFEVGDEVELREVKNGRIILGVGRIMGLAGKSTFHSQKIQPGYANILVIKVFAPDAPLVVPNLDDDPPQRVLSDAVGSSVLWPEGSLRRACLASKGP
ncbi:hypothetical protein R1sor_025498 [Riccia sorocarpa]|uniref:Transposase Tnp1/En/Spm-like domain-containing protein n=1 Tax=Riccia sorocarpa TaxID=122646 RepID=A0ABD3GC19_9MARC